MSALDFDKLQALNEELEKLHEADKLDQVEFDRILEKATEAVGDRTEFLEGVLMRGAELGYVKP